MKTTLIPALAMLCIVLCSCATSSNDTAVENSDNVPMISSSEQNPVEPEHVLIGTPGHSAPAGNNNSSMASASTRTVTEDQFDHPNATQPHANTSGGNPSMLSSSSVDEQEDTSATGSRTRLRKDE